MARIHKYIWVVNTLLRAGERGISLKELNEKWVRTDISGGMAIPRQTFDRWKRDIADMMGVDIECHRGGHYGYYISNPDELDNGTLSKWLLDTYATYSALSRDAALKSRIVVEDVPSSHHFLTAILDAMRENKMVEITYQGFGRSKGYTFPIAPYCVKMSQKRWYVLARSVRDNTLRIYALDRIIALTPTAERFALPADFDAQAFFAPYFGVVLDEGIAVQRVVVRANSHHQHYLRTLPLHPSQRELSACADYADFELTLRPTYDFYMNLLSAGNWIEVLSPQSVREGMRSWLQELGKIYM